METPSQDFLFSSKKYCLISCWQHMLSNSRGCGCTVPCVDFYLLLFSVWLFSSALPTPLSPELLVLFRVNLHSPARLGVGESVDCRHQGRRSHPSCLCKSFPSPSWLQFYTFPCLVWYFPGFWRENKPSFNCLSLQPAFSVLLTPPFTFHLLQIIIIKVY